MQLLAPAKINLSLKVLGRRQDGFHEIETLMAPISLTDRITVEKQSRWIDVTCDDPSLSCGDDNLVTRAAKVFFETTAARGGVKIAINKKIPAGAGLGGGSSDAATTLAGLNRLFETGLSHEDLAKLGSRIGSDVPFFVFESAAICRGRGELVKASKLKAPLRLLLLKPDFGVSSAWAYSRWRDSKEIPEVVYEPQELAGLEFSNDLERPVFEKFVFLAELKMWLLNQPEVGAALMSGSGSTMFAVMREGVDAERLATRAKAALDPELWTQECETL